jgi:hypothetical protein
MGKPSCVWDYRNEKGRLLMRVCRFDPYSGSKVIRPLTYCENEAGARGWRWRQLPELRPLYGLDCLAERSNAPVLIVEGEKTADAAAKLFPEYV